MTKLTIMRGISGSGKSTKAREIASKDKNAVIISRDDLRFITFGRYTDVDEDYITEIEFAAIRSALSLGKHVISDNTHIAHRYVNQKVALAWEYDAAVEIVEVTAPLDVAQARNAARTRVVPENVIEKQYKDYKPYKYTPLPTFAKYSGTFGVRDAYLFDIDGTLAMNNGHRDWYDWTKVEDDDVVDAVANVAGALYGNVDVIIFSGRDESSRDATERWLDKHGIPYNEMYMRPDNDKRPDNIVKMEMFDWNIRHKYNVLGVFDDRPQVVRAWMKIGVPVFHVAPYAKDF